MRQRTFSFFFIPACLLFSSLLGPFLLSAARGEKARNWNCLIITIDTLRADHLSCYDPSHCQTPHIDALARRGILFSEAFAHTTTTLPSHTNIFLGVTPPYHGVHDNANFAVGERFLTLAELLKNHGYSTGAFVGAYPLDSRFGLDQGFDLYDDDYGIQDFQTSTFVERKAEVVVSRALDWLQDQKGPWFLWLHCFDPHHPYEPPEPFAGQYKDRLYEGEVAYVDFSLGRLFDYLEKNKLFDRTLVIFTADHGESLGEHGEKTHGYLAYNSTLSVPLILVFPGAEPGRVDREVFHIDIFPTVCDLLKIEKPSFLQGLSLIPLTKKRTLPRRAVYFESLYPYYSRGWAPLKGYIDFPEKFIESPIPELYDLRSDASERKNLAPGRDVQPQMKKLTGLIEAQSFADGRPPESQKPLDRASVEKLKSLGYVTSPPASPKKNFRPEEDVKSYLPFENKATEAMDLYKAGRVEEAVGLLKGILEQRKDIDIAYADLAAISMDMGKTEEALSVLRRGLDSLPQSYAIFLPYVSYLLSAKEYEEVIRIFQEKNLPQAEHDPEIWNSLGVAFAGVGKVEDAISAYEKSISLSRDYPPAYTNLGTAFLMQAQLKKDPAALEKAIQSFQRAIELDPAHAAAYNGLGGAYKMSGRLEDAIACWKEALRHNPDFDYPLYNLGLAYLEKGDPQAALTYFLKYKERFYSALSPGDKRKLDDYIQKCR
jgi:arylsulfatase A-like enzyme/Flp pilus assembly protein TadD